MFAKIRVLRLTTANAAVASAGYMAKLPNHRRGIYCILLLLVAASSSRDFFSNPWAFQHHLYDFGLVFYAPSSQEALTLNPLRKLSSAVLAT